MKIRNELVSLKIGKKKYDFHNLIMDEYLKRFIRRQLDVESMYSLKNALDINYCLIKFDTPLNNIAPSSIFYNQDFDICIIYDKSSEQTISERQIIAEYSFSANGDIYDYETVSTEVDISKFYGRKITAIGFNVWPSKYEESTGMWNFPVCAILDISNYNIYLQENQMLSVTRRDIIETDAIFYSNNKQKIPGPIHLAPFGLSPLIAEKPYIHNAHGILYSVGLSSYTDYIDKEYIIGNDVQVKQNGTELIIKDIKNYLSTDSSLFCNENLNPSSSLYPVKSNYKYIILKYKVYQDITDESNENIHIDTGYYYYMAIPINKFGKSNLKIKYERG